MDIVTYALSKKYADSIASDITNITTDGNEIYFTTSGGTTFTVTLNSVASLNVSASGHLIVTLTNGDTIDAGALPVGTMDTALSATSENGVQNKVITAALGAKQNTLTAGTAITIDNTDPAAPVISANNDYTNLVNKPTALSAFTNDQGFITNTVNNLTNYYLKTATYSAAEIDTLISNLHSLTVEIVETLPTQDISTHTIYLVNITGTNNYNQWMYINNAWSNIGSTSVDLTNYYTKTQTDTLLDDKVDKVTGYGLSQENFTSAYKDQLDNYTVDTILDSTSSNPIANSAVTNGLDAKQNKTLTTSLVIDGTTTTTVEAALGNLNTYANKKLTITSTIPVSPSNGDVILYTGTSTADYKQGGVYQYQVSEWVLISAAQLQVGAGLHYTTSGTDEILEANTNVFNGTMTQWDTLTTAQKKTYTSASITEDSLDGSLNVYSTSEVKTNKVWIDGKPIYRKVVDFGTMPDTAAKSVAHGISSLGTVVELRAMMTNGEGWFLPIPFVSGAFEYQVSVTTSDTNITVTTFMDRTAWHGWAIIEYTKTTD